MHSRCHAMTISAQHMVGHAISFAADLICVLSAGSYYPMWGENFWRYLLRCDLREAEKKEG